MRIILPSGIRDVINKLAAGHGIADNQVLTVDDAGPPADDEFCRFTANGIEGRSYSEVRSDLGVLESIDEDDMASDLATKVPTQQSVKAYVSNTVRAPDAYYIAASDTPAGYVMRDYECDGSLHQEILSDCETVWTSDQGANVVCTADAVIYKVGTKSAKIAIGAGASTGLLCHWPLGATADLTTYDKISFKIYATVALVAADFKLRISAAADCSTSIQEFDIPATYETSEWYTVRNIMTTPANFSAVASVGIVMAVDKTVDFYLDDIKASKGDEEQINTALETCETLVFLPGTYKIDPTQGMVIPSNRDLIFRAGATVENLAHDLGAYQMMKIWDVENVYVYHPVLDGKKGSNLTSGGEWGHGIDIRGSTNIRIEQPIVSDCWGDGIQVGVTASQAYCEDVIIEDAVCDGNKRNGFHVASAKHLTVLRGVFRNTSGISPQRGIDIEPNFNTQFLEDVNFIDCITEDNDSGGINLALSAMGGSSNIVSVNFIRHHSKREGAVDGGPFDVGEILTACAGRVVIDHPIWEEGLNRGFYAYNYAAVGPRIDIISPTLLGCNTAAGSGSTNSGFVLVGWDAGVTLGNIHIYEPNFVTTSAGAVYRLLTVYDSESSVVTNHSNISFIDPVRTDCATVSLLYPYVTASTITDRYRKMVYKPNAAITIATLNYGHRTYTSLNFTADRILTLDPNLSEGREFTFESYGGDTGTRSLRVGIAAGQFILPGGTDGQDIYSTTKGARLTLRRISSTVWFITEQIGTWTFV